MNAEQKLIQLVSKRAKNQPMKSFFNNLAKKATVGELDDKMNFVRWAAEINYRSGGNISFEEYVEFNRTLLEYPETIAELGNSTAMRYVASMYANWKHSQVIARNENGCKRKDV